MSDSGSKQTRADLPFALVVTGFGIGWLAGLSVSPVVSIVITTLTGSVATIIAALSGVKEEFLNSESSPATLRRLLRNVTPVPLAWLVAGLLVGTVMGIAVRTNNWLSPTPPSPPPTLSLKEEIQQWVDLGLDQQDVVNKYFASRVNLPPPAPSPVLSNQAPSATDSVLFATASPDECVAWQNLITKGSYTALATEVASSKVIPFRQLPTIITDTVKLATIVGEVLCVDSAP